AVGLQAMITLAICTRGLGRYAIQQTTGAIAGYLVGADIRREPVFVVQHTGLDTIPLFAVNAVCFPPYVVAYPGCGHQVAFVGGIDKHLATVSYPAQRGDRNNLSLFPPYARVAVQPFVPAHVDSE